MSLIDRARALRPIIERLATALEDEQALDAVELFPAWKTEVAYAIDDRVRYEGILYKVLQAHTSQTDWTPDTAVSLYAKVLVPDPEQIPVWEQPGSTNGYKEGARVYYPTENDSIYRSKVNNNAWPPTVSSVWEKET